MRHLISPAQGTHATNLGIAYAATSPLTTRISAHVQSSRSANPKVSAPRGVSQGRNVAQVRFHDGCFRSVADAGSRPAPRPLPDLRPAPEAHSLFASAARLP